MRRLTLSLVLPPISTAGLTASDVDNLTKSTQESMLKTLVEMSEKQKDGSKAPSAAGISTAVEI